MLVDRQLDKDKIKGAFAQAATRYDAVADLQRRVAQSLVVQIQAQNLTGTVLDVGCGTGFLTSALIDAGSFKQIYGLDIALPMLEQNRQKIGSQAALLVCADVEQLPLANQSVNHIVSNLALQWCENLQGVFIDFKRVLKPSGRLIFSTFGIQTLHELKSAWAGVDIFTHVNQFRTSTQIADFLQQGGFRRVQIQQQTEVCHYLSVTDLMRELKAIGAHNVTTGRCKGLTGKAKMQAMISRYETLLSNGLIPATFEILTVTAQV